MRVIVETQSRIRARKRRRAKLLFLRILRAMGGAPVAPLDGAITFQRVSRVRAAVRRVVPDPLLASKKAQSMVVGLVAGVIHVAFALVNMIAGLLVRSVWTFSVGVFIALINAGKSYLASGALMGGTLDGRPETTESLRRCRRAGLSLMVIVVAMSGTVARLVVAGYGRSYPGVLIYLYAGYALIQMVFATANLVRARREEFVAVKGVRLFNLVCTLVSIFALQTVLLSRVAWERLPIHLSRGVVEGVVGGSVCVLIVFMGLWLVVAASTRLAERRGGVAHRRHRE